MYCLLLVLLEEAVTDVPEPVAPEEGQELDLPEIELSCLKNFVLEICPRDNHRDEHISLYP